MEKIAPQLDSNNGGPLVTEKPASLFCFLLVLCLSLSLSACKSKSDTAEDNSQSDDTPTAADVIEAPCTFVRASRSLVSINIETEDRECTLVLPQDVTSGELGVAVSVAGRSDVASIEIRTDGGGYYYANQGTVTITEVGATRIRGRFVASDDNPPDIGGPWGGEFDVTY